MLFRSADFFRDLIVGIHHLRCRGAVSLLNREPADADSLIYALVPSQPGLEAVLQYLRRTGSLDLGDHLAAAADAGVELRQRDHTASIGGLGENYAISGENWRSN